MGATGCRRTSPHRWRRVTEVGGFASTPDTVAAGRDSAREDLPEGVHGYTVATLIVTLFLLFLGAMVKSTGSSLAVPDWPLSFGQLFPELKGGVFYEHIHRAVAGTVVLLTFGLALWLQRRSPSLHLRRLGWMALALVVLQAVFGGVTVLMQLPPLVSIAHAATAQTFLVVLGILAVLTAPAWRIEASLASPGSSHRAGLLSLKARALAGVTFWLVFAQIFVGALFRHTGKMLHLHILLGIVVLVVVHLAFFSALKAFRASEFLASARFVRLLARYDVILTGAQVLLGLFVYLMFLSKIGIPLPSFAGALVRSLHLWLGSLILLTSLLLWLWASRLVDDLGATLRNGEKKPAEGAA
jgi:heme A synthase